MTLIGCDWTLITTSHDAIRKTQIPSIRQERKISVLLSVLGYPRHQRMTKFISGPKVGMVS